MKSLIHYIYISIYRNVFLIVFKSVSKKKNKQQRLEPPHMSATGSSASSKKLQSRGPKRHATEAKRKDVEAGSDASRCWD